MTPSIFPPRGAPVELSAFERVNSYLRLAYNEQTTDKHAAGLALTLIAWGQAPTAADYEVIGWLAVNQPAQCKTVATEMHHVDPAHRARIWSAVLHTYGPAVTS